MKRFFLMAALGLLFVASGHGQTQGCAVDSSSTDGSIQSFAYCQPWVINGRNQGGWIALNRNSDTSNTETNCYDPANVIIQNGLLTEIVESRSKTCKYYPAGGIGSASTTQAFNSAFVQWNTFRFTLGEIQIRAKGPSNVPSGGWPAIWLLGANCEFSSKITADNTTFNGKTCAWHAAGSEELDIFEQKGSTNGLTGSFCSHFLGTNTASPTYTLTDASANWHIYGLQWTSGSLKWFLDGVDQTGCDYTGADVPSTPMFLQMNIAMNPGSTSTGLPSTMQVDWVKVCQPSPCSGNGGNIIFYDDFVTPVATSLLRPIARMARLAGVVPAGTTLLQGVFGQ